MLIHEELYKLLNGYKEGNELCLTTLLENYEPLIRKFSKINGVFDEDLYSEQRLRFIMSVNQFINNLDL